MSGVSQSGWLNGRSQSATFVKVSGVTEPHSFSAAAMAASWAATVRSGVWLMNP